MIDRCDAGGDGDFFGRAAATKIINGEEGATTAIWSAANDEEQRPTTTYLINTLLYGFMICFMKLLNSWKSSPLFDPNYRGVSLGWLS